MFQQIISVTVSSFSKSPQVFIVALQFDSLISLWSGFGRRLQNILHCDTKSQILLLEDNTKIQDHLQSQFIMYYISFLLLSMVCLRDWFWDEKYLYTFFPIGTLFIEMMSLFIIMGYIRKFLSVELKQNRHPCHLVSATC